MEEEAQRVAGADNQDDCHLFPDRNLRLDRKRINDCKQSDTAQIAPARAGIELGGGGKDAVDFLLVLCGNRLVKRLKGRSTDTGFQQNNVGKDLIQGGEKAVCF